MASSVPTTSDPAAPPAPRQESLDSIAAQVAAIDLLVGLAQRSIRVFDIDLSETGWGSALRSEGLGRFLRGSRLARLEIIVHDLRHLERSCARLRSLQRSYADSIAIFRTGDAARGAMDPMVIVDARHYLHRFHVERPRAELGIEQPQAARVLGLRFDEIWATRDAELPGTVLGL
jgi:hypothetical protein